MRRALALALLPALALPARADGPEPEARASLAWDLPGGPLWEGQVLALRLRVAYDRAAFEAHALPLFARALDVPLSVEAAGLDPAPGRVPLAPLPEPSPRPRARIAVNGQAEGALVEPAASPGADAAWARLVVERRVRVPRAGPLELPAPRLRFAWASSFAVDALGERAPVDRREVVVLGEGLRRAVQPLPIVDRPEGFVDAVGRFSIAAQASAGEVVVGAPFRLRVTITGTGNLESLTPPPLDRLGAFHLYGLTDDHGLVERTLVAELAATRDDVREIPALALAHFDPESGRGFATASSAAIPLAVRPDPARRAPPAAAAGEEPAPTAPLAVGLGALLLVLLGGWVAWRVRARAHVAGRGDDAASVRLRSAAEDLSAIPAEATTELADAFAEVLAARLRAPRAAVIAHDLAARLELAGVAPLVAREAAAVLEALVSARYGAVAPDAGARARAVSLGRRLSHPVP